MNSFIWYMWAFHAGSTQCAQACWGVIGDVLPR